MPSQPDVFRQRWRNRPSHAMISVHRGLWGPAPENSLAAIDAARTYDIIEIDTQIAGDGVPVVIHDPDLVRTTGNPMRVVQTDHSDLISQPLRAGSGGPEAPVTDQRIPLLEQGLSAAGPKAYFDIDVKHPGEVDAIAKFLHDKNLQSHGSLKIDTASKPDIDKLLSLQDNYDVMVMAKVVLPDAGLDHIRDLTNAGVAAAELWFDDLEQLGAACQIAGTDMAISTYTLDPVHCCGLSDALALTDPDRVWGQLLASGVTIIMTDQAAELDRYMASRL